MAIDGMDKFSHLEDKIYRAVELCKSLQLEKERLEKELELVNKEVATLLADKDRLEKQVERLREDRGELRLKVEAMLDAIAMLEMEADSLKK